ncbi:hypothetical protein LOTGIDRAFT_197928, partial [Lottia gigantea]
LVLLQYVIEVNSATCACATLQVHVRSGAGTKYPILGSLAQSKCLTYEGNQVTANGYKWAHVTYNGKTGYVATNWLHFKTCSVTTQCACTTTSLHVRSGSSTSHSIIGTLQPGHCAPFLGDKVTNGGLEWAHLDFDHTNGWAAAKYLTFKNGCSSSTNT